MPEGEGAAGAAEGQASGVCALEVVVQRTAVGEHGLAQATQLWLGLAVAGLAVPDVRRFAIKGGVAKVADERSSPRGAAAILSGKHRWVMHAVVVPQP